MMLRALRILAATTMMLVSGVAPAAAGGRPEIVPFTVTGGPVVYALWTDICGFPVIREWEGTGRMFFYPDGSVRLHVVEKETLTGPGGVVAIAREGYNRLESAPIEQIDEAAGTLTLTFDVTVYGTLRHIFIPGDGRLLHEAGQERLTIELVIDLATGEVVTSDLEVAFEHGQHSQFHDADFAAELCAALAAEAA